MLPSGENGEAFDSTLKFIELCMNDKHLLEGVPMENQNLQNENGETGNKVLGCNSLCSLPLDVSDSYISPGRGQTDSVFQTELKPDQVTLEEKALSYFCTDEHIQECRNKDLEAPFQANQQNEVVTEAEVTGRINSHEGDPGFEKCVQAERLSFVGDWPIEQTIGQRVKRNKRLEKLPKQNEDDRDLCLSPLDSKACVADGKLDLIDTNKNLAFYENKHEGKNQSSAFSVGEKKDTSELLMVGDWPVQSYLEQRQHKTRKIPKRTFDESEGNGSRLCNAETTVALSYQSSTSVEEEFHGTLPKATFQAPEISTSETMIEKTLLQSKRTHKPHKLALTFNNHLTPDKPTESSLFSLPEDKPDECILPEGSKHSQTEPQDFALLWRIERKMIVPEASKVLDGRLDGFIPKGAVGASNVPAKIPYKVTYDKGTHVEEGELVSIDESENLNILCNLFGSFSFDALKDLYERCNKDIDWATGILLDSAEKLCKDDDNGCLQKATAEPPGIYPDPKQNVNLGDELADLEEMTQVTGKSNMIQDLANTDFSINESDDKTIGYPRINTEISNLVIPLAEKQNLCHQAVRAHAAKLNDETSVSDPLKRESNLVMVSEKDQQVHPEIDLGVPIAVPDSFNVSLTPMKPPANKKMSTISSEKHQLCSEIEDAAVQVDPICLEDSVGKEGNSEARQEIYSAAAEHEESKMPNQGDHTAQLMNSMLISDFMNIDSLELVLPPELAIQLSEIFGPVCSDSGNNAMEWFF